LHFLITVSMWSLHDILSLTVTTSNFQDKQDLITESWYWNSG